MAFVNWVIFVSSQLHHVFRQCSCPMIFAEPGPVTQIVRLQAKREKKDWQEYLVARK